MLVEPKERGISMFKMQRRDRKPCVVCYGVSRYGLTYALLLSLVVLLLAVWPLRSQEQAGQQQPTFSTDVKVVNVLATVRDKKGQIIRNLTKDDFTLEEDGRRQTIGYFVRESDLPLTLGLLVDTSLSQARVLDQERSASSSFLDQMLREKDMAFLIHFDLDVELLQDLTSSRKLLRSALESLQTPQPRFRQGGGGYPQGGSGGGGYPPRSSGRRGGGGGGTTLYDTVYLASNEIMKRQQGRKALIVLSDGVDNASKVSLATAIESAQRADTLVYSILFSDPEAYWRQGGFGSPPFGGMGRRGGRGQRFPQSQPVRPDGKKIMERLSKETGARLFEVTKKQSIEQIYASIEEELRNQYSLGYTPDRADAGAGYRRIMLTTRQKDLIVQTRDGYYAER